MDSEEYDGTHYNNSPSNVQTTYTKKSSKSPSFQSELAVSSTSGKRLKKKSGLNMDSKYESFRNMPRLTLKDVRNIVETEMNREPDVDAPPGYIEPHFLLEVSKNDYKLKEKTKLKLTARDLFMFEFLVHLKNNAKYDLEDTELQDDIVVTQEEENLECLATFFMDYIKQTDQIFIEAKSEFSRENRGKLDSIAEIKSLQWTVSAINKSIQRFEDNLLNLTKLEQFLDGLAPTEWVLGKYKNMIKELPNTIENHVKQESYKGIVEAFNLNTGDITFYLENSNLTDKSPIYFTEPNQLRDLLADLEEHNITLIEHNKETTETIQEAKQALKKAADKLDQNMSSIIHQIDEIEKSVQKEKIKSKNVESMIKRHSFTTNKIGNQDALIDSINVQVLDLYRCCFGDTSCNLSNVTMLTEIEHYVERLSYRKQAYSKQNLDAVYKKILRDRMLIQKAKEQDIKLKIMEKKRKKLLYTFSQPKKPPLRKLMYRSVPTDIRSTPKKVDDRARAKAFADKEYAYFFS